MAKELVLQKYETISPGFYKNFSCLADKCELSCCLFESDIPIEKHVYEKCKDIDCGQLKHLVGKFIIKNQGSPAKDTTYATLVIGKYKSCPFFSDDRICRIHSELGLEYMNNSCRLYPRRMVFFNNRIEKFLSFTCVEAVRLALLPTQRITFDKGLELPEFPGVEDAKERDLCKYGKSYLAELKYFAIDLMQDRSLSVDERLYSIGCLIQKLQKIDQNDIQKQLERMIQQHKEAGTIEEAPGNFIKTEPDWSLQIQSLAELADFSFKCFSSIAYYHEMGENIFSALGFDNTLQKITVTDDIRERYLDAYRQYYLPFMMSNPHLMENYLVCVIFANWYRHNYPMIEHYARLVMLYAVMRFLLIGLAASRKRLDTETVIELVSRASRPFRYSQQVLTMKMSRMRDKNQMTMEYLGKILIV